MDIFSVNDSFLTKSDYLFAYGDKVAFLDVGKCVFFNNIDIIVTDVDKACFYCITLKFSVSDFFSFVRSSVLLLLNSGFSDMLNDPFG